MGTAILHGSGAVMDSRAVLPPRELLFQLNYTN